MYSICLGTISDRFFPFMAVMTAPILCSEDWWLFTLESCGVFGDFDVADEDSSFAVGWGDDALYLFGEFFLHYRRLCNNIERIKNSIITHNQIGLCWLLHLPL